MPPPLAIAVDIDQRRGLSTAAWGTAVELISTYQRAMIRDTLEFAAETSAAIAALLWFWSARVRLSGQAAEKRGLSTGLDDPKALLRLVYKQSQRSAWAAVFSGLAALFALADGLVR